MLGGSVRRDGDRVRITANLVNAEDGYQLWSEQYDRNLEDVFAVQEEIANAIAERLQLGIDGQSRPRLRGATTNARAHDAYLTALGHWHRRATEVNEAILSFTEATRLDPNYALAFVGLASAFSVQPLFTNEPPERALAAAQAAVDRALAIDSVMPQPWATAAHIAFHFEIDNAKALQLMLRAFELGIKDASAYQWLGEILEVDRRYEDAEREHRWALQLDPLSTNAIASYADFLARHDPERAETQLRRVLQLQPDFRPSRILYGTVLLEQERWSEAAAQLRYAADSTDVEQVVNGLVDPSRRSDALQAVDRMQAAGALNSSALAELALSLGDQERALSILESAAAGRDPLLVFAQVAQQFAPLMEHPRFVRLFSK